MNNFTLVTCLYDLQKRETSQNNRRSINEYLNYTKDLDCNMIIYCDPELEEEIRKRKTKGNTLIIPKPLEELKYYLMYNNKNLNYTISDYKNTKNYFQLIWNKFSILKECILFNPFKTDYFYWIDYGLQHVFEEKNIDYNDSLLFNKLINNTSNKTYFTILNDLNPIIMNDENYYKSLKQYVIGGLFGGHKNNFIKIINLFDKYLYNLINTNIGSTEEQILAKMVYENKDLFELSFGDYCNAIDNFIYPTSNIKYIFWIIKKNRTNNTDKFIGYTACKQLYENYADKRINLSIDELFTLLYNYYIISYYYICKEKTKEIGNIFINNLKDKNFNYLYLQNKNNIDTNLSYCNLIV